MNLDNAEAIQALLHKARPRPWRIHGMAPSARDHRGSTQRVDLKRNSVKNLPRGENDRRCSIAPPNTAAGYWQVCLLYQNLPLSAPRPRKRRFTMNPGGFLHETLSSLD